MRGTRLLEVGYCAGEDQCGSSMGLIQLRMARGGPHNSRATSYERMHPNLGESDGVVAVSFVLSRPVLWDQSSRSWLASGRVGTGAQPLQGENYTYSRVLGHVHSYSSVTSSSLVCLDFSTSL